MNSCAAKTLKINLNIGDQLTSISCGHVVVELMKFIVYQRLQIPYTYQWLKQIVNKRKMRDNQETRESFQSERHFRIASTALENFDFIIKSLLQEINDLSIPEEVCITFGATPVTCKEVYRLLLPTACHKRQCQSTHIANDNKIQRHVFKTLVTSELLNQVFSNQISPMNMHVFIRKKLTSMQEGVVNSDNFVLATGCRIPRTSKVVVIDFRSEIGQNISCCNEFQVFGNTVSDHLEKLQIEENSFNEDSNEFNEIESTDGMKWYQSSYVMKGFKDCMVNGVSVTNTWV